jgi:hypothetical protein
MADRPRKSEEYWKEVIKDFLLSGLSQENYTRKHKICRATLLAWSKRLEIPLGGQGKSPQVHKKPSLSFIEVKPSENFMAVASSLKVEIYFSQGHKLKLETEGDWSKAGVFIKTLMG